MLDNYFQYRDEIIFNLNKLIQVAKERGNQNICNNISDLATKLNNNTFLIAAFGGFSSGKSTFFNALVGEKIFPSLHTPTTASINFLTYNDKSGIIVNYKSAEELKSNIQSKIEDYKNADTQYPNLGKSVSLPISELTNISRENLESIYVRDIIVQYPSEHLKPKGVIWIDTPGTDSVIDYHKNVTYNLIDKADAILFFIYAPVPFKNSDWIFLEDIKNIRNSIKTDKFFFILNAIDAIENQPIEEVLKYVKNQLEKKAGIFKPNIIPISSKLALYSRIKISGNINPQEERELRKMLINYCDDINDISPDKAIELSRFQDLESALSVFLNNEKAVVLINSTIDRALRIHDDIIRDINLEKWSIQKSVDEFDELITNKLMPNLDSKRKGIIKIIDILQKELQAIQPDFSNLEIDIRKQIDNDVENDEKINTTAIEQLFQKNIYYEKKSIESKFSDCIQKHYPEINELFDNFNRSIFVDVQLDPSVEYKSTASKLSTIKASDFMSEKIDYIYEHTDSGNDFGIAGAIGGGILAFLIPGGLGLLGGALLGGLVGKNFGDEIINKIPIVNNVVDVFKMKKNAESIAINEIKELKKLFSNILIKSIDDIVKQITDESDKRINNIRMEISKIQNKRNTADQNKEKTNSLLNEQISHLEVAMQKIIQKRIGYNDNITK